MLSALLDWPLAAFASHIVRDPDGLVVTREIDTGAQTVRASLPAVVTVDLRLNTPRFASLPNIMKARKAPLEVRASSEFIDGAVVGLEILRVAERPARGGMRLMSSVPELVDALRDGNVI
jgi:electron transfer flavoprotein beta subunit